MATEDPTSELSGDNPLECPDLQREPLALNERFRVTADGLQWIVQKARQGGKWDGVIYCQTQAGLIASIGYGRQ
jgi:hypothetical protein